MWKALESLYQNKNENRRMLLQERMRSTKMTKGEGVVPYLTKLTQIREDAQHQDDQGRRSGALSHEAHIDQG